MASFDASLTGRWSAEPAAVRMQRRPRHPTWLASDYGVGTHCARYKSPLDASSVSWLAPTACSRVRIRELAAFVVGGPSGMPRPALRVNRITLTQSGAAGPTDRLKEPTRSSEAKER